MRTEILKLSVVSRHWGCDCPRPFYNLHPHAYATGSMGSNPIPFYFLAPRNAALSRGSRVGLGEFISSWNIYNGAH